MPMGKSLILQEMAYRIADQWYGIKRQPHKETYSPFPINRNDVRTRQLGFEHHVDRPFKFHRFPYWADLYFQEDFYSYDMEYSLESLFKSLHYLGPLRAQPNRTYAWSGAQPHDMGPAGELVVDAILASRRHGEEINTRPNAKSVTMERYIAQWLKHLGLVHDFGLRKSPREDDYTK